MPDGDVKAETKQRGEEAVERLDVLIVGAGLSGVGAACHLLADRPSRRIALLEARDAIGGTWDLFRYPGVRSDSDMQTLGYRFRPWHDPKAIADGADILTYVRETARAYGVDRKVRFGHRVTRASWSSDAACWTIVVERDGGRAVFKASFLMLCSGYYSYAQGYAPVFEGIEAFGGQVVHPQFWPADLDCAGKRVVVIGSGATAVTLVPALAKVAAKVTMLQRSPSYVMSLPTRDAMAAGLRRVLPERTAGRLVRARNILLSMYFYGLARRRPERAKARLIGMARRQLPAGYDVETHFTPRYRPWDQRVCFVPDGDLFRAIREGRAEVATDRIERFEAEGIRLASGRLLPADVVVTATGLSVELFGGAALEVDGRRVEPGEALTYKGMMLADVPNAAFVVGYTNASWTLKADLVSTHVCRLLNFMRRRGYATVVPVPPEGLQARPIIDFTSGYVQRALDMMPKQGDRAPWTLHQNYVRDSMLLRWGAVRDRALRFGPRGPRRDAGG